jgi:hypothetical protein
MRRQRGFIATWIELGAVCALASLAGCVGSNMPEAGMDAGISCESVTAMLDNPVRPGYPVMDLGPCNHVGDTCQSMSTCMTGNVLREWHCTCESAAQRWVCGVTMYCTAPPTDAME